MEIVVKRVYLISLVLSLLTSCGYKPSSHYYKRVVGQKIYTEVEVSISDPENVILVKDALNRALYTRLKSQISKREESADSTIKLSYKSIHFKPLQYNRNGYVVYYQADTTLRFNFENGKDREERLIVGHYEFPIRPSAIISNDLRFKAIENGSLKALDEFISYLAVKGLLKNDKK